jgi:hypothetical protein
MLSSFRPEGLFFLLTILVWRFSVNEKFWLAGIIGVFVGLTRPQGLAVSALILFEYLQSVDFKWKKVRAPILACAGPAIGIGLYSIYCWHLTGNPKAWSDIQQMWGREYAFPLKAITSYLAKPVIISHAGWDFTFFNWLSAMLALITSIWLLAKRRWSLGIYPFLSLMISFSSGTTWNVARYVASMFPLYIAWAGATEKGSRFTLWLSISAALLALFSAYLGLGIKAVMG